MRRTIGGTLVVAVDMGSRANVRDDVVVRPSRRLVLRGDVPGDPRLEGDAGGAMAGDLASTIRRVAGPGRAPS